jgi:hypothetical protein
MFKFLKHTALYILALPLLCTFLGVASNQLVLNANHDRFPVMLSDYKVAQYEAHFQNELQSDNPEEAMQAQFNLQAFEQEGFLDDTHVVMTSHTHLNLLADRIDVRTEGIESVGDILIDLGDYTWQFAPIIWGVVVIYKLEKKRK